MKDKPTNQTIKIYSFILIAFVALVAVKCPEKEVPKPVPEPCAGINFTAEFDVIDNFWYPIPASDTALYYTDTLVRGSSFSVQPKMQGDYMYYIDYKNDKSTAIEVRDGKKWISGGKGDYISGVTSEIITMTITGKGSQSNCKAIYSKTFPMIDYWNNPRLLGKYRCIRNGDTSTGFDLFIEPKGNDLINLINTQNGYMQEMWDLQDKSGYYNSVWIEKGVGQLKTCSGNNLCSAVLRNDILNQDIDEIFIQKNNLKMILYIVTLSQAVEFQTITGIKL